MKKVLVTGASGLIGSEVVVRFYNEGNQVLGVDNNMRKEFFGDQGDTTWNRDRLLQMLPGYRNLEVDIRGRVEVMNLVKEFKPDVLVHCAAQPSHDLAASRPFDDFDVNAVGTLNLLEAVRQFNKDCVFVHMSTNKVYGDGPNSLEFVESDKRFDYAIASQYDGIDESFSIDQSMHSIFGASKVAADVMVQEYGKYFSIPSCCLRGGCLTGPMHSGVQLHGFLSYLIQCNTNETEYTIFGYQGKQVRDNIHSVDVTSFIRNFVENPRCGEVYNLGGGRENSTSILEAFDRIANISGLPMRYKYSEENRKGDHICYISNLSKIYSHYPDWELTKSLQVTFEEIYQLISERSATRK